MTNRLASICSWPWPLSLKSAWGLREAMKHAQHKLPVLQPIPSLSAQNSSQSIHTLKGEADFLKY